MANARVNLQVVPDCDPVRRVWSGSNLVRIREARIARKLSVLSAVACEALGGDGRHEAKRVQAPFPQTRHLAGCAYVSVHDPRGRCSATWHEPTWVRLSRPPTPSLPFYPPSSSVLHRTAQRVCELRADAALQH